MQWYESSTHTHTHTKTQHWYVDTVIKCSDICGCHVGVGDTKHVFNLKCRCNIFVSFVLFFTL
jgi:hypothetical protein